MSVFGALNRFISRLDSQPDNQSSGTPGYGFQVLRNTDTELALEPWFDFVIGINGRNIDNPDPNLFATEVRNCAGATVSLGVWSAKGQRIRELYVNIPTSPPSLGLSLQWSPLSSSEDVWHILDVTANSPADVAGLLPYGDYVIGSPEGLVRGESGLGELVEDYLNRPLRLYVYNNEYNVTRTVTITPSRNWGGQGALGCVLGFGALHRIPPPLEEPPQAPGETLFEGSAYDEKHPPPSAGATDATGQTGSPFAPATHFLVPAELDIARPASGGPPTGAPPKARKQRAHHVTSPNSAMDEYFKEGEEKSRAQDVGTNSKPSTALPPPPKVGGPPRGPPSATATPEPEASEA